MYQTTTLALLGIFAAAIASPLSSNCTAAFDSSVVVRDLLEADIVAIAPKSASCANATYADECLTAAELVKPLRPALQDYGFQTLGHKAALVGGIMSYESGDFQYNINHFPAPGRPGQGTKAMLMFPSIVDYANGVGLGEKVVILNGGRKFENLTVANMDDVPAIVRNAVRMLVLDAPHSVRAASWYLAHSENCPRDTSEKLANDGYDGFAYYIEQCVQTTIDADRLAKWCLAVNTLKPEWMDMPENCTVASSTASN